VFRLFYGRFVWKYFKKSAEDNMEAFSAINISLVEKPKDIDAGLDNAFAIDEVVLDSKSIKRYRTLTKLPPIFQVYLQRQDYDPEKRDTVINKHHIHLNDLIYLDRFTTDDNPERLMLREESWDMDSQLLKLREKSSILQITPETGKSGPDLLDETFQFISSSGDEISADSAIAQALQAQAKSRRADLAAISARVQSLESQKTDLFSGNKEHPYRLTAVFVHRGQGGARGGHYWVYVRDFQSDKWRRYEDSEVREVLNTNEIFKAGDPGTDGAPYFCVYVRDDRRDEIIDAVFREKPDEEMDQSDDLPAISTSVPMEMTEIEGIPILEPPSGPRSVMEWED
jgi:ubiquitin carboxyl-terminal hydrolase 25/28